MERFIQPELVSAQVSKFHSLAYPENFGLGTVTWKRPGWCFDLRKSACLRPQGKLKLFSSGSTYGRLLRVRRGIGSLSLGGLKTTKRLGVWVSFSSVCGLGQLVVG